MSDLDTNPSLELDTTETDTEIETKPTDLNLNPLSPVAFFIQDDEMTLHETSTKIPGERNPRASLQDYKKADKELLFENISEGDTILLAEGEFEIDSNLDIVIS